MLLSLHLHVKYLNININQNYSLNEGTIIYGRFNLFESMCYFG